MCFVIERQHFLPFDLLKLFVLCDFAIKPFHSCGDLLGCGILVENTNYKVSSQVRGEEGPVVLRNGRRLVVDVVDGIDPHVPCVVKQVCWNLSGVGEERLEMGRAQSRGD